MPLHSSTGQNSINCSSIPTTCDTLPERIHPAIRRIATSHKAEHVPLDTLEGLVIDDTTAVVNGYWWTSENLPGYIGDCYRWNRAGKVVEPFAITPRLASAAGPRRW